MDSAALVGSGAYGAVDDYCNGNVFVGICHLSAFSGIRIDVSRDAGCISHSFDSGVAAIATFGIFAVR